MVASTDFLGCSDGLELGYDFGLPLGCSDGLQLGYDIRRSEELRNWNLGGCIDGFSLGFELGRSDGLELGFRLGPLVGLELGSKMVCPDEFEIGLPLGCSDGISLGLELGRSDGLELGFRRGTHEGLVTMRWDNPTPMASQDNRTKGRCPPRVGHPCARRCSPGGGRGCLWLPRKARSPRETTRLCVCRDLHSDADAGVDNSSTNDKD